MWLELDLTEDVDVAPYLGDPGDLIDVAELVASLTTRPEWHENAACRGQGSAAWFPGPHEMATAARAVCAGCPVTADCLRSALERPYMEDAGVWAGTSRQQRRRLRRLGPPGSDFRTPSNSTCAIPSVQGGPRVDG